MKKYLILLFLAVACLGYAQDDDWSGGDPTPAVNIDGLLYRLNAEEQSAKVANGNSWEGELTIPEQVTYEGKLYTVNRIEWIAFMGSTTLTKVKIPKTLIEIWSYAGGEENKNPFRGCVALESIEVDEDNPSMCSVDGVLFSKDTTWLYSYPAGATATTYSVPDGVTRIGASAFRNSPYLQSVEIPNSVLRLGGGIFWGCKKLESVRLSENLSYIPAYLFDDCESLSIIDIPQSVTSFGGSAFRWTHLDALVVRGLFSENIREDVFSLVDQKMIVCVQRSEIPKFKKVYAGSVLPIDEYTNNLITISSSSTCHSPSILYDLQGRRVTGSATRGIYVKDGRKVMVK